VSAVLFHKTLAAAMSGSSPRAHKERLASALLRADFFGKRVKVGVIILMNHGGNREILSLLTSAAWH